MSPFLPFFAPDNNQRRTTSGVIQASYEEEVAGGGRASNNYSGWNAAANAQSGFWGKSWGMAKGAVSGAGVGISTVGQWTSYLARPATGWLVDWSAADARLERWSERSGVKGTWAETGANAGGMLGAGGIWAGIALPSSIANADIGSWFGFGRSDITVSRWDRSGLESGDWVMKGSKSPGNYVLSGKWQPGLTNQFAPYGSGQTFVVPPSTVIRSPGFWGTAKYPLGQRIYVGPGIPPP